MQIYLCDEQTEEGPTSPNKQPLCVVCWWVCAIKGMVDILQMVKDMEPSSSLVCSLFRSCSILIDSKLYIVGRKQQQPSFTYGKRACT